jgi:hypothetical protein
MIPLGLGTAERTAYLERLFGSHNFEVDVQILNMNEQPLGTAVFLDGQKNFHADAAIRATASLTISDPEGAFDFADAAGWSPRSAWADRLIRVRHTLDDVTVTAFIGIVSTIDRSGADVRVELQDKSALAVRGCPPMTVRKGANAVEAIERILRNRTGEFRFRFPKNKKRLSQAYSVGWDDDSTPLVVCRKIARRELGMQLIWTADGYALLRKRPSKAALTIPHATGAASMSADFTVMDNWVRVRGHKKSKTKNLDGGGTVTTTSRPVAIARIKAGKTFSPEWLARKGVRRYWPRLVDDDSLRKLDVVKRVAREELRDSDQLQDAPGISCVPFFHGDADDLVRVNTPGEGGVRVRLGDCSIPFGVGGDMTIGVHRTVSRQQPARVRGHIARTKKVKRKKKGDK